MPAKKQVFDINRDTFSPQERDIQKAARIIRSGGLVAFPTETVYGLGANALDGTAVARIFKAKGRPADNPLIVHLADFKELATIVRGLPDERTKKLAGLFWPGPLTLVLLRGKELPEIVTAGLDTVAVRIPAHPVALSLIKYAGVPIAAPSANLSGRPSPTTAQHVLKDLDGRVDYILDGGPTTVGLESTVLDLTGDVPVLLRPGGVTVEDLRQALGRVDIDRGILSLGENTGIPRSPGMKYKHYAPKAKVIVVEGNPQNIAAKIIELAGQFISVGQTIGAILTDTTAKDVSFPDKALIIRAGNRNDLASFASALFDSLRRLDHAGVDVIIVEGVAKKGLGLAIMDRLERASGGNIIKVDAMPGGSTL